MKNKVYSGIVLLIVICAGFYSFSDAKGSDEQSPLVGQVAPEISLPNPEGQIQNLSSLRGKLVLIDFWASWCGPCRKENPHVVAVYNKYKDKGFTILSVSLDSNKDRWVQAIQKDGMEWHHVSDLKGWSSSAASLYGVRSIPATFLVGKDGKIIATNLRGAALENQVKKSLGK
jgi:thiol-disulfide isomerase/thioredoxin